MKTAAHLVLLIMLMMATGLNAKPVIKSKSGNPQIDSLQTELKSARPDTNKVSLYYWLSFAYSGVDTKEGLQYGREALELARKLRWEKGISLAYNALGVNYLSQNHEEQAKNYFDSSIELSRKIGRKKGLAVGYRNLSIVYQHQSDFQNAVRLARESEAVYKELGDLEGQAGILNNLGNILLELEMFDAAEVYFRKALPLYMQMADAKGTALILGNLGSVYQQTDQYDSAMLYLSRSEEINKNNNYSYQLCYNLYNKGVIYQKTGRFSEALKTHQEGLRLAQQLGSRELAAFHTGRIGRCYLDSFKAESAQRASATGSAGNLSKALENLQVCIDQFHKLNLDDWAEAFLPSLAEAYTLAGDYQKAYDYNRQYTELVKRRKKDVVQLFSGMLLDEK